jgi:hypothetical protein
MRHSNNKQLVDYVKMKMETVTEIEYNRLDYLNIVKGRQVVD